jgi:hypothetical protein
MISHTFIDAHVSIADLPSVLVHLFERAQRPLLPGSQEQPALFVRYLRRKPGRGLALIYSVAERGSSAQPHAADSNRSVSLTLDESALDGRHLRFTAAQVEQAPLEIHPSGVLRLREVGLSVQAYPADGGLPTLAACRETTPGSPLWEALQAAAQVQLRSPEWRLIAAQAHTVRYKPANRCVLRYHLLLEHPQPLPSAAGPSQRELTLFGKVYADPAQARRVQSWQHHLYDEQEHRGERPLLPQPLGMVDALGLTLTEAVQASQEQEQHADGRWGVLWTGTHVFQPQWEPEGGDESLQDILPEEELHLTAQALARLHASRVCPTEEAPRTGAKEAKRVRERAALLAGQTPTLAGEVQRLAHELATSLEAMSPASYHLAHGGFKPSQLLFHSHHVFVVDFDGLCLADPALDVSYFLAYLHPSGLWYQRSGMRQWFEAAAELFGHAYGQAMLEYGVAQATIDGILERSRLYEAALLFKIATRRVNRLNSPRPQELSAMLNQIAVYLSEARRG